MVFTGILILFHVEHITQKALVMSAFCAVNRECVMVIAFFVIYFQNTGCVCESDLLSAAIM